MSLKRKLLRFISFICGAFLMAISPFFIFHTEFEEPVFTPTLDYSYEVQQMWIHTYYMMFGLFLFIVGFVLIVASYYRHVETHMIGNE